MRDVTDGKIQFKALKLLKEYVCNLFPMEICTNNLFSLFFGIFLCECVRACMWVCVCMYMCVCIDTWSIKNSRRKMTNRDEGCRVCWLVFVNLPLVSHLWKGQLNQGVASLWTGLWANLWSFSWMGKTAPNTLWVMSP